MGIEDIQISEELMTNAPSIKYSGNEGPKSPQEMEQMMMAQLEEEYLKYVDDALEQGIEPMTLQQYMEQAMAEAQMSGGQPLPQDPTKPVNPFQPKPTGPTLPDRQTAAYGGIMGMDGRKQYGIGSFFQKAKDKFVDDIIPNEIKDNPVATALAAAYGLDTFGVPFDGKAGPGYTNKFLSGLFKDTKKYYGERKQDYENKPGLLKRAADFALDLSPNTLATIGGGLAGLFTKNTDPNNPGTPNDDTALQLADLQRVANTTDPKQAMAIGLNFTPSLAARKYSPAEMAVTYANAANGGRIGYNLGGRIGMADGGIMDLGGMEKDYRAEGGFVPIGREEKADDVPARLSVNEFVFTADAVRNAGGGDIDQGAKVMENMMKHLEAGGQVSEESQGMAGAQQMFETSERLSEVI